MKDDEPILKAKGKTISLRLTVAREFASETSFNQASAEPQAWQL